MTTHIPDEILNQRILSILNRGPMTVAGITIALDKAEQRTAWDVRQGISDLMHEGKVVEHTDGKRYKRVSDYSPGPTGGEAA